MNNKIHKMITSGHSDGLNDLIQINEEQGWSLIPSTVTHKPTFFMAVMEREISIQRPNKKPIKIYARR